MTGPSAYAPAADVGMASAAVTLYGGQQPHENMPPYLVLSFCIAVIGTFPIAQLITTRGVGTHGAATF